MVSGTLLDILDSVGRLVRRCPHVAFGGLQIVLCGDFYQLPPVGLDVEGWAFESQCWSEAIDVVVELTELMRLEPGEIVLAAALEQIRRGVVDDKTWQLLHLTSQRPRHLGMPVTEIVSTNSQADRINEVALQAIVGPTPRERRPNTDEWVEALSRDSFDGELFVFESIETGSRSASCVAFRATSHEAPRQLKLCVGATIVLIRSICLGPENARIPNGTICSVVGFGRIPEELYNFHHPRFDEFAHSREERRFLSRYCGFLPRVRAGGHEGLIYPTCFTPIGLRRTTSRAIADGAVGVMQLPLRLGWAVTVHRAQGGNLGAAVVHLEGAFVHGQAYVALSRVRRASDLWIAGRLPKRQPDGSVTAFAPDPKVAAFYDGLGASMS